MKIIILFLISILILMPGITFGGLFGDDPPEIVDLSGFPDGEKTGETVTVSGIIDDDCWELGDVIVSIKWGDGSITDTQSFECKSSGPGVRWLEETDFKFEHIYYNPSGNNPYNIEVWVTDAGRLGGPVPGSNSYRPFTRNVTGESISADDGDLNIGGLDLPNPFTCANITCIVDKIIDFIFTVAVILLPVLIIVAGIMFLAAVGDPAKIKNAKKIILYALIGFAIITCAKLFVYLVTDVFLGPPTSGSS